MRLLLTAVAVHDGAVVDLALDCEDDALVDDVARSLADRLGVSAPSPEPARGRGHLGVIDAPVGQAPPPRLFVGDQPLPPDQLVSASPLRHGVVVGVGSALPDVLAEPRGSVELRIASGPGAGQVHRLAVGSYDLGRGADCAIRIDDDALPETALTLDVGVDLGLTLRPAEAIVGATWPAPHRITPLEGPIVLAEREDAPPVRHRWWHTPRRRRKDRIEATSIERAHRSVDPQDDRALADLDRVPLVAPTPWLPGQALGLGSVVLEVAPVRAADASLSPSPNGATLDYNRPPRLLPPPRPTEFSLPKEPQRPDKQPVPFLMVLAPVMMGALMFAVTRRAYTLLFLAMSPLLMMANFSQSRRTQVRRYKTQSAEYIERKGVIEHEAFQALVHERGARRRDAPDPGEVLLFATGPRARLWERRRTDPDWMTARIGTADVPSEVVLRDPARESHQGTLSWTAPDVPVTVALEAVGVTGIAGPGDVPRTAGRWIVSQMAALHSPADLEVVVLADPDAGEQWQWVRWLPHTRPDEDSGVLSRVGADEETTTRRVAELLRILEGRREQASANGGRGGGSFGPMLVVLDGARRLRLLNGMVTLLREGPALNIAFLCLDADERLLPEECRAVVTGDGSTMRLRITGEPDVEGVRPDVVAVPWCERIARALAPVKDVSQAGSQSSVPTSSRLLSVLRQDPPTGDGVAAAWGRRGRTTKAVIGETGDGPFELDIRRDGPHGLVAGTTGSGKSELLQTIIGSLALGNRPDEMTFVLVDYKGGAAFKDCNRLPHTVGMVTDLDGHLTGRALESLGAELRRREHQLADADAKDIEDYLSGREPGDPPMPRLLIVIDEFAALVSELPDFVTGLVDIARRGRSLGVHLILATQRPAGVVSAEIKSNTNLRIALRVTDSGDSQDVIDSGEAAEIAQSTPGRGLARLGHSSLIRFQSSRVGGRPRGEGVSAQVGVRDVAWSSVGSAPTRAGIDSDALDDVSTPTDLAMLVAAVTEATRIAGVTPPPSPWLPPLPDAVDLDALLNGESVEVGVVPRLPMGLADHPGLQRQDPMWWDLPNGSHLAIAGQPRSGRSTVLRQVAGAIGRLTSPIDVHLYGLDCGNNALLPLISLPHTGAVVSRDQPDRVRRLLSMLGAEISRRQQLLAEQGYADISEQRAAAAPQDRLPYLVLLLDRWEGFIAGFEAVDGGALVERMGQLLREGPGMGLRAVVAGDKSVLVGRMTTVMEDRLLLRMSSPEEYTILGMRAKDVPVHLPPGRAFRAAENPIEVQLALLDADPAGTAQVAALHRIGREAHAAAGTLTPEQAPRRVDELPTVLTAEDARAMMTRRLERTELLIGFGGDTLGPRTVDVLDDGQGFLVVGPPRSGRSSVLVSAVTDATSRGWHAVIITPRRSPLRDLERSRGVDAVFTDTATAEEVKEALKKARTPRLLVIDDFEVMGGDSPLSQVAEDYLKQIRDDSDALLVACGIDEAPQQYRGPVAAIRKGRNGLILSPRASSDGDIFTTRLPRSIAGGVPTGRGVLIGSRGWEWVQVPRPSGGSKTGPKTGPVRR